MIKFVRSENQNGHSAYLVNDLRDGSCVTMGTIVHDGNYWLLRWNSGRVERHATLAEAKNDALKGQ